MFIQYASGNLSHSGMTKKNKEKLIIVFIIESSKRFYEEWKGWK